MSALSTDASFCDDAAIRALVREQHSRLFAWFRALCRDDAAAADLTQATFAAYFESTKRRRIERPVVWLFRIGRNLWRAECRARKRARTTISADADPAILPIPDNESSNWEALARVRDAVEQLPAALREAIALRYWSQLSIAEIAVILHRPRPLIRWRLHHAREQLRRRLIEFGMLDERVV